MRASYRSAHAEDVERLRESFERGAEWTRKQAEVRWGWHERRFRHAVSELRLSGYPVISSSEAGSVYRKARSREEVEGFIERELLPRANALREEAQLLQRAADHYFGTAQLPLAL